MVDPVTEGLICRVCGKLTNNVLKSAYLER